MKLENLKVYDLEESIIASGYPMRTAAEMRDVEEKDIKRCLNLTKASNGNGAHGQWMTGVRVAFDLTFSNKAWIEAGRYRFFEFVSSQSTMHRITKFDVEECCNSYVLPEIKYEIKMLVKKYNALLETKPQSYTDEEWAEAKKELYLKILYNIPSGFELKARITTNYRCLLNIWVQRHDHRLPEWREFCDKLLELPYFKELVDSYNSKGE